MKRRWGLRLLGVIGTVLGVLAAFAVVLQVPAVARAVGSPGACGTCHTMSPQVAAFARSAHRQLACAECHTPSGVVERAVEEVRAASRHVVAYFAGPPDVVHAGAESRDVIQANCVACHAPLVRDVRHGGGRYCFDCHRFTPHDRPLPERP